MNRVLFAATVCLLFLSVAAQAQGRDPGDCQAAAERLRAQCLAAGGAEADCQARVDEFLAQCEHNPPPPPSAAVVTPETEALTEQQILQDTFADEADPKIVHNPFLMGLESLPDEALAEEALKYGIKLDKRWGRERILKEILTAAANPPAPKVL